MTPLRIVLFGAPASGKSEIARGIVRARPDVVHVDLDRHAHAVAAEAGADRMDDQLVDRAVERAIEEHEATDAAMVVLELAHHDHPALIGRGGRWLTDADLVVVVTCPYADLIARNADRERPVPDAYLARAAASAADLPALLRGAGVPWVEVDTGSMPAARATEVVVDLARRSTSTNLRLLDLLVDPQRPWVGGHLRTGGEWSDDALDTVADGVRTFLDVGAGTGHVVRQLTGRGVQAWGIEPSPAAHADTGTAHRIIAHDFVDGWLEMPCRFDLVWCVEVLEHLDERAFDNARRTIAAATGRLLVISAGVPGQPGFHHVNCREEGEWAELIRSDGFDLLEDETERFRFAAETDIGPFGRSDLADNALVFQRRLG